jgi:hypothetical protein
VAGVRLAVGVGVSAGVGVASGVAVSVGVSMGVGEAVGVDVGDRGDSAPGSAEQPAVVASTASITAAATRLRAGVGCGAVMASGR